MSGRGGTRNFPMGANRHLQRTISIKILLTDVESNPGADLNLLKFCCWNLNSICAHDFMRISLVEAYNSVFRYI